MRSVRSCALFLALSSVSVANSYIVDDTPGPGVDFQDIPAAIAFAQPGDVLVVRSGTYSGFVLDRGLVIVAESGATALGPVEVRNLPLGPRAAIVGLGAPRLVVDGCLAPVVLQDLGTPQRALVIDSSDVRIARTQISSTVADGDGSAAIRSSGSRLELVDVLANGRNGVQVPPTGGTAGAPGIHVESGSLRAMRLSARGGNGTVINAPLVWSQSGGPGIELGASASAIVTGLDSTVSSGFQGINFFYANDCDFDACAPSAIVGLSGSTTRVSGTNLIVFDCAYGFHCIPYTPPPTFGVTLVQPSPADPSLEVVGVPTAGAAITFTIRGQPGAQANLLISRALAVHATPGVAMERLVGAARTFNLGPIPASGAASSTFTIPATLPRGFVFCAQAEIVGTSGLARTNSTPLVLR